MPPYAVSHAHYNAKFAKFCIDAFLNGRKTFMFECSRYNTAEHVKNIIEDIKNGYYSFKISLA